MANPVRVRLLHPPRTGGTSIVKAWGLEEPAYQGHALPNRAEVLAGAASRGARIPVYVLTIRNPWDRIVSLYHHANHRAPADPDHFRWWLVNPFEHERQYGGRFRALIARPCADWLVENAYLVPFENRETALWRLQETVGRDAPDLHENRTKTRLPYPEYYVGNPDLVELVGHWYADDVAAFGYTFEGVDERAVQA